MKEEFKPIEEFGYLLLEGHAKLIHFMLFNYPDLKPVDGLFVPKIKYTDSFKFLNNE